MAKSRMHRRLALCTIALLVVGVGIGMRQAIANKNRISSATILGRWDGYFVQKDMSGHQTHVTLTITFRPDGLVNRGYGRSDANHLVHDNVVVFYNIRSRNAPHYPVVSDARLVGDTLTIGTGDDASILKRAK